MNEPHGLLPPRRDMLDLAFVVQGRELPRAHRAALAAALRRALPWLDDEPALAVHRLNVAAGGGPMALLSGRTRLTLRLPRARVPDARALEGASLEVAGERLHLGAAQARELLAFGTQYAHFVCAAAGTGDDELAFVAQVQAELDALGVPCRIICGRAQTIEAGELRGFSLMLDGLNAEGALRVLQSGVGPHRLWGCGVFVPHKSAAAVGQPP